MIDYVTSWAKKSELPVTWLIDWLELSRSKFYDWRKRYGKVNEHNSLVPRDHWLEDWEKEAIIRFAREHPHEGHRPLTYMMLDRDIVAVSPASVYRVLRSAGLLARWNGKPSKKGTGFVQPLMPHQHWHVDISHVNVRGTFYYLCSVLDGYSRYITSWEIWESMKERDIEVVLQRGREKFPEARPRIISDNGPQFIAKDFKTFLRVCGMTHVKTSPYYPESNGKKERWYRTLKEECIRPKRPESLEEARAVVGRFVDRYNNERLHSAIGYVTPKDKLEGLAETIWAEREAKLAAARERRRIKRAAQRAIARAEMGEGTIEPFLLDCDEHPVIMDGVVQDRIPTGATNNRQGKTVSPFPAGQLANSSPRTGGEGAEGMGPDPLKTAASVATEAHMLALANRQL